MSARLRECGAIERSGKQLIGEVEGGDDLTPGAWYATGIQSTHFDFGFFNAWNEARKWDATTYAYFDAYGIYWP